MASPSPRHHALPPPGHHRRTLSSTLVDESVAAAAALVHKWHPDDAPAGGSLFLHGAEEDEPRRFLRAAADLHRAMLFFASDVAHGSSHGLVEAQALLQTAMRRLDLELRVLLDDIDSIQSDHAADASRSRNNIRAVAEAMMAAGYGKECISTFKTRRRAALTASLRRLLGFSPPVDHLHKITWDQLDARIIPSWLAATTAAFGSLFAAEKDLCDAVFAGDNAAVGEAVFATVANDQATGLLAVTEAAAARARRAPERLFRVLDVHDALTEALPALLSVFGDGSEVAARAALSVAKVGEAARGALGSLEAAIQKEPSKATAAGGAVHPLTRYVMNYVVFLADYKEGLALLYDYDYDSDSSEQASPSVIHRYLFLANNTRYVANKVAGSGQLRGVLGDGWAEAQSAKARVHVGVHVRATWDKVTSLCTQQGGAEPEAVEAAVMEAVGMQEQWVAADDEMCEALRAAAVPKYRMFYRRHGAAVRLTPGDVTAMITALFGGPLDLVSQRRQEDPNPYRDPTRRPRQLFT
nr:exocyst complex component EXO70H1-like [Setaria viridis]